MDMATQPITLAVYRARRRTLLWNLRRNRKWNQHFSTPTLIERLIETREAYWRGRPMPTGPTK